MIQLYGLRMSNYYSLAKALLIEKGLAFEEVKAPPTQKEDNLARSPMGRMPSIGVDGLYLSETLAIAAYLERLQPEPVLIPSDPFAAGKVIELACHIKLDVELVARRCLGEAFFGQTVSDEVKASTEADLDKGMKALDRIFIGAPYARGRRDEPCGLLHLLQLRLGQRRRPEDLQPRPARRPRPDQGRDGPHGGASERRPGGGGKGRLTLNSAGRLRNHLGREGGKHLPQLRAPVSGADAVVLLQTGAVEQGVPWAGRRGGVFRGGDGDELRRSTPALPLGQPGKDGGGEAVPSGRGFGCEVIDAEARRGGHAFEDAP